MTVATPRFYVPLQLVAGSTIELPEAAAHHLRHVLRINAGEELVVFNGKGGEFKAVVESSGKKSVTVVVHDSNPENRTSTLPVHLGLCIQKRDAMDRAITRCVELGISTLTPLVSERCTVSRKLIRNREDHWHQVSIAACEQCGLNLLPIINAPLLLTDWLNHVKADIKIVASPDGGRIGEHGSVGSAALLTGPEGGLTEGEIQQARVAGFEAVKLGSRILRGENAPAIALAVIQNLWGDFA